MYTKNINLVLKQLIDTHAHLFDDKFKNSDILDQIKLSAIDKVIVPATNLENSSIAKDMSTSNRGIIFSTIGIHPTEIIFNSDYNSLKKLQDKLLKMDLSLSEYGNYVAIGECGLDYYWIEKGEFSEEEKLDIKKLQNFLLLTQFELAEKHQLPIVVHLRDIDRSQEVYTDFLKLLNIYKVKIQLHSFSGDHGFFDVAVRNPYVMFSFTAFFTQPRAGYVREIMRGIPLDRLMLETDSPYVLPYSIKAEYNSPLNLPFIASEISKLKEIDLDLLISQTDENAEEFFALK